MPTKNEADKLLDTIIQPPRADLTEADRILDGLLEPQDAPSPQIPERQAATAQVEADRQLDETLLQSGAQIERPAFDPPETGDPAQYLREFSGGLIDLAPDSISQHTQIERELQYKAEFAQSFPNAFNLLRQDEQATGNKYLPKLFRTLVRINHTPPSPKEQLTSIDDAWSDWFSAQREGRFDNQKAPPIDNLDPAAVQHVFGKLIHPPPSASFVNRLSGVVPGFSDLRKLDTNINTISVLSHDSPYGDEFDIFRLAGGNDFLNHVRKHQPYYVARSRYERLGGGISQSPGRVGPVMRHPDPDNPEDPIPSDPAAFFNLHSLMTLRPEIQQVFQQTSSAAGAAATDEAARAEGAGNFEGAVRDFTNKGGLAGSAMAGLGLLGQGINAVALGLPERLFRGFEAGVDAVADAASAAPYIFHGQDVPAQLSGEDTFRDWFARTRAGVSRWLASSNDEVHVSNEDRYNYLLNTTPGANEDEVLAAVREDFSLGAGLASRLRRWQAASGKPGRTILSVFGMQEPAAATTVGNFVGSLFDEPEAAALTLLGASHFTKRLTLKQINKTANKIRRQKHPHAFTEYDENTTGRGRYSRANADVRATLFQDTFDKVRSRSKTPDQIKSLIERTVEVLDNEQIPIEPEIAGAAATAARAFQKLPERGFRSSPHYNEVVSNLSRVISDIDFTDGHFILEGADAVRINPATSAELVRRLQKWTEAVENSIDSVPTQPRRVGTTGTKMAALSQAVIKENRRVKDAMRAHKKATELLGDTANRLSDEIDSSVVHSRSLSEQAGGILSEHHAIVDHAITRAEKGGLLYRASKKLDTPEFKALLEAERPGNANAITDSLLKGKKPPIALREALAPLARQIDDIRAALKDAAPDTQASLISQAESLVAGAIDDTIRAALEPTRTPVRLLRDATAIEGFRARLADAISDGSPVRLTKADRQLLNLPEFDSQTWQSLNRSSAGINTHTARLAKLLDDSVTTFQALQKRDPAKGGRLPITDKLHTQIAKYLDSEAQILADSTRRRVDLGPAQMAEARSALRSWNSLKEGLSKEQRLLENEVLKFSSIEAALAPPQELSRWLKEHADSIDNLQNFEQARAAAVAGVIGRELSQKERALLHDSMRTGKIHKDLPKDVAEYTLKRMQDQRYEALRRLTQAGFLTEEMYDKFAKAAYYHGAYWDGVDPSMRAKLNSFGAERQALIKGLFAPLRTDDGMFSFKIPEDSFWVAWSQRGKVTHKAGFKTAEEALEWATANRPKGSKLQINPPKSIIEKELEGLVFDPAHSHLRLTERLLRTEANLSMQQAIAHTPHARVLADLVDEGAEFSARRDVATSPDGKKWYLVTDKRLPHLNGRYISEDVPPLIADLRNGYEFLQNAIAGIQDTLSGPSVLQSTVSRQYPRVAKTTSELWKAGNGAFALVRVGLNIGSYMKGWIGNLFYSRRMGGLNPFNPFEFPKWLKGNAEGMHAFYRTIKDVEGPNADAAVVDLIKAGHIDIGKYRFAQESAALYSKHWKGMRGIQNRIQQLERRASEMFEKGEPNPGVLAKTLERLEDLQTQAAGISKRTMGDIARDLGSLTKNSLAHLWNTAKGETRHASNVWQHFSVLSGDIPNKIANYKALLAKGVSKEVALERIGMFSQNLQRAPFILGAGWRRFLGGPGGSMFTSFKVDQLRILGNTLKYDGPRAFTDMGLLAMWNLGAAAASGDSIDERMDFYAAQKGVKRGWLSDFFSLSSGIEIPIKSSGGGTYRMPVGTIVGTEILGAQSVGARQLVNSLVGENDSAVAHMGTETAVGVVSAFAGSSLLANMVTSLVRGEDEQRRPMKGFADYFSWIYRTFTPSVAPGNRIWESASRLAAGQEIDPNTFHKTSGPEFVARMLLGVRPYARSPDRMSYVMRTYLKRTGAWKDFVSRVSFDDLESTKIARAGEDPEARKALIREIASEKAEQFLDPDTDELRPLPQNTNKVIRNITKRTSVPNVVNRFSRQDFTKNVAIYGYFRVADPTPDEEWDERFARVITSKLPRATPVELQGALEIIQSFEKDPRLSDDARKSLNVSRIRSRA
jgi:hypothetical protein